MDIVRTSPYSPSRPLVATIGFFDGVHLGHRHLLDCVARYASAHAMASAAITFPVHPRKVLHQQYQPQTLTDFDTKLSLLSTTFVDVCIVIDFTADISALTARQFLEMLYADYGVRALVMGYDHRFGSDRMVGFDSYFELGRSLNIEVIRADAFLVDGMQISSSYIRKQLQAGEVSRAQAALGRPYRLCGTVVHGCGIGRNRLGFPTANLRLAAPDQLLPRIGVYAVIVWVDDKAYGGMLNVGLRPTVHANGELSIEVNIFDLDCDLYGKALCLDLIAFIRPEKKLAGEEALIQQLSKDKKTALQLLERKAE